MKFLSKISWRGIANLMVFLNSLLLAGILTITYLQYQTVFYLRNKVMNADEGYVGVYKTVYSPGDTLVEVTDVYKSYDLLYRIGTMQYNVDITKDAILYHSFEIISLDCTAKGCGAEKVLEFIEE